MANPLSPILRTAGLDPSQGYDTGAAGAKDAQAQANKLSDLQWNRQMQGLGQAQGYTNQLQSLYNSIYSPGGGQAAPGGMQMGGGPGSSPQGGGSMLLGPPPPPTTPAGNGSAFGAIMNLPGPRLGKWIGGQIANGENKIGQGVGWATNKAWDGLKSLV